MAIAPQYILRDPVSGAYASAVDLAGDTIIFGAPTPAGALTLSGLDALEAVTELTTEVIVEPAPARLLPDEMRLHIKDPVEVVVLEAALRALTNVEIRDSALDPASPVDSSVLAYISNRPDIGNRVNKLRQKLDAAAASLSMAQEV